MSQLFVLLFSGGIDSANNFPRYAADLQRLGKDLQALPGAAVTTIAFLFADGTAQFTIGSQQATVLAATRGTLKAALGTLSAAIQTGDRFIFVATNHGGLDDAGGSILYCWDEESVRAADFNDWVAGIKASLQVYIFGQCNGGGFLAPLADPKRFLMSASQANEPSYATQAQDFDEFLLRVAEALENQNANRDLTLSQLFTYAQQHDTQSEHPQLSDIGGIGGDTSILNGP